jgi:hypothetical protein
MYFACTPIFAASTGSGFFISNDGYFVTNYHVIAGGEKFFIRTIDDKKYLATVVRFDQSNDLAVLKVEGRFKYLSVEDSFKVKRGTKVVTIGFPHTEEQGIEPKITEGIVNSLTGMKDDPRYFQISVQVGSGNSGGPLVNMYGNVVGIVSSKLKADLIYSTSGDVIQNVNYAVKSNYLRELMGSIPNLKNKNTLLSKFYKDTESLSDKLESSAGLVVTLTSDDLFNIQQPKATNTVPEPPPVNKPHLPESAHNPNTPIVAGNVFRDCPDCPDMIPISSNNFAIGKTEVTQGQWMSIMGTNPSLPKNCGADCPVNFVSWYDAQDFAKRLSEKTGRQYRLPYESEWEIACTAGTQQKYCGGESPDAIAWYGGNNNKVSIHPVAMKNPNIIGLYDMTGNVDEWTLDCWKPDCNLHVLRGGRSSTKLPYATEREGEVTTNRYTFIGFRVVRLLP